ncbi:MAG TPA: S53 family peptidase [Stellaceae bacterium]|nr:S53 family peptidase [Stellaceae bacterium]
MRIKSTSAAAFAAVGMLALASGASHATAETEQRLVNRPIDDRQTEELAGNTRPEAKAQNDRGRVSDGLPLEHMQLLLRRPSDAEAALTQLIDSLHDRSSPNYHQWLTAEQFGREYGPAEADIAAVSGWLASHGFTVGGLSEGRTVIDFSGTAGEVREAFHTEIHQLDVRGARHIANMSDPRIPAALAGVVEGIVSLHDFRPHTNYKPKPAYTFSSGGSTFQAVVPGDLATIYNFTPQFKAGISGQGQTVIVIEDTNVFSTADWTKFRSTFGLSSYTSGSFSQIHPSGSASCTNPGVVAGDEGEAELDAEWASAAAPSATIKLASCSDTSTFGGLIALENLVNSASPPAIVSISYGECEAENGATANAAYNSTYKQGVAEGMSIYVSAGDEGAASCDADLSNATHGIGVSGFASTPYNVAVGGTDFGDTFAGTTGTYWNSTNSSTYESAKSYINEIPWNDSCASVLIATASGYATTYGSAGFCNSATGKADYLTTASGSGGPSRCATGKPATAGVVGGTCAGYAKPSWQSLVGFAGTFRSLPDVSLFAANGVWGHYYVYCDSDTADGGAPCTGAPSNWAGAGGTSFSSPIWAGIQALVNQKTGAKQGNPNPTFYSLARTEYGTSGSTTCNSSKGKAVASSCIFYDVTQGDMDVNCTGTHNCYRPSGTYGVLSTSNTAYAKAYGTGKGWDFATGIGTVNVNNLVNNW